MSEFIDAEDMSLIAKGALYVIIGAILLLAVASALGLAVRVFWIVVTA